MTMTAMKSLGRPTFIIIVMRLDVMNAKILTDENCEEYDDTQSFIISGIRSHCSHCHKRYAILITNQFLLYKGEIDYQKEFSLDYEGGCLCGETRVD